MKPTQLKFVMDTLLEKGEISRNYCLNNYISRLGARIDDLEKIGWKFRTEKRPTIRPDGSKGNDFVYVLIHSPQGSKMPLKDDFSAKGNIVTIITKNALKNDYKPKSLFDRTLI